MPLLAGLSPAQFMRRHWQRKPLRVHGAWPDLLPLLTRAELFALAARDDVESRLVVHDGAQWRLRRGPLPRRALPPLARAGWSLLVQGVDLQLDAAHTLLAPFRFIADARFDDVMVSFATDGGGVGPHVDAYDVFLLQLRGRRRWRIGPVRDTRCIEGAPLKLLRRFRPTETWLAEPGDLLYLPPMWGHDGVAAGECMTASIGFRAPTREALLRELLPRIADSLVVTPALGQWYHDAGSRATNTPARIPATLQVFTRASARGALRDAALWQRALGCWLTEPKAQVWFERGDDQPLGAGHGVRLDRRSRMMYDAHHVFINGECVGAVERDARILRMLADRRRLAGRDCSRLGAATRARLAQWVRDGWVHGD